MVRAMQRLLIVWLVALAACSAEASSSAPHWEELYSAIIQPRCVSCHKQDGLCPYLDLTTPSAAYRNLLGVDASSQGLCRGTGRLVVPNQCEASVLYRKLLPGDAPCGNRMPLRDVPLTSEEIDAVCQWIDHGALP